MERLARNRLVRMAARRARFVLGPVKNAVKRYERLRARRLYHVWAVRNEQFCFVDEIIKENHKVSIIVPTYNTDYQHLMEMVYSVVNQHYQNWELVLVNASSDRKVRQIVDRLTEIDTRIVVVDPGENLGIAANTNAGIKRSTGVFTAFLDHDDVLHPCALHAMMHVQQEDDADVIYSDEDKINHDGVYYFDPLCKPDWSPHLFENVNYINHLTIVRSKLIDAVKGLMPSRDGAQDYDLLLRIIDSGDIRICHTPHVLYHWRAAKSSTANDISTKPYIFKAGQSAMQDHFHRNGSEVKVKIIDGKPGFYKPIYPKVDFDLVINSPSANSRPAAARWLTDMRDAYPNQHVIVGEWYKKYVTEKEGNYISFIADEAKNISSKIAENMKSDTAVIFRSAATPWQKDMLREIAAVSHATQHIVQPLFVSENGDIEDAGLVEAPFGLQPLFIGCSYGENTFIGNTDWVRDLVASNGLAVAVPKKQLDTVNTQVIKDTKKRPILWAHAVFELHHLLQPGRSLAGFNPLVKGVKSDLSMVTVRWPKKEERAHE